MSSDSGAHTSSFKYGYEDNDVVKHTTAGQVVDRSNIALLQCNIYVGELLLCKSLPQSDLPRRVERLETLLTC